MLASTHRFGRDVMLRVWSRVTGSDPSLAELQIAGAVASLETSYGKGWKGAGSGSNNWGAINCLARAVGGECPEGCFPAEDSSPGKAAEVRCFRIYPSPDEGAAGLIKEITIRRPRSWQAMREGDIDAFSRAMHGDTGDPLYYEGTSTDPAVNVDRHAAKVASFVNEIAQALGESVAATRGGSASDDPLPPSYY